MRRAFGCIAGSALARCKQQRKGVSLWGFPVHKLFLILWAAVAWSATTTVSQPIVGPDGLPASGTVNIRITAACASGSDYVGTNTVARTFAGTLTVKLVPNDTCVPSGTSYTVGWTFSDGRTLTQQWLVPTSGSAVTVDAVVTASIPTPSITVALGALAQGGASANQAMCWTGTVWAPGNCGGGSPSGSVGDIQYKSGASTFGAATIANCTALGGVLRFDSTTHAFSCASLGIGDLPTGTSSSTIALGNHTHASFPSAVAFGTTVIDPTGGIKGPVIACAGAPGSTIGPYGSLCGVRSTGALWSCVNAAGCTLAGDWVAAGGGGGVGGGTGPGYLATSSTSVAIGAGSKTFTTQAGLAYSAGAWASAASGANAADYMVGPVVSYSGTALVIGVTLTGGSGTHADWNINLSPAVSAAYACSVTGVSSIACTHNLSTTAPWVTCYDASGNMLGSLSASTSVTSIVATSSSVVTLTFSGSTTGTCTISTGSQGPAGIDGTDGAAATIAVGTVTTGAAGSSATVVNAGTPAAGVFDFTIPRGATGAPGSAHSFGGVFDGAGVVLTPGSTAVSYMTMPYACTIGSWDIIVDAGTATFKVWKIATGTAIPTSSNSISTSGLSISTGTTVHSTTVSDFTTTTVNANDVIGVNLFAASGVRSARLQVQCQ